MTIPPNLVTLHAEEERIRVASIELIARVPSLREHLQLTYASMAVVFALSHDHKNQTKDELTIQYIGLRIFNTAASSIKLGLSGYYQAALVHVRDIYETVLLLDYFRTHPQQISIWDSADKKRRIREFGPAAIRKALDERDGYEEMRRKQLYDRLSEYASHATSPGFRLLAPDGLGKIGPFLDEKYLRAWLEEIVQYIVHGGTVFLAFFREVVPPLLLEKQDFLAQVSGWQQRYLNPDAADSGT